MRQFLCLAIVCVFAASSAAQVNGRTSRTAKSADGAGATPHKSADAKKADQAEADEKLVAALLAAMDTDKDGVVTKSEMAHALAALHKVKKDPKGNITVPDKAADATDPNAAAANDPNNQNVPAGAAAENRGNADIIGRFMQYDTNHDGVLSPNEVPPQARAMLRGADLNGDGVIDAAELQAFARKMGDRMRMNAAELGGAQGNAGKRN